MRWIGKIVTTLLILLFVLVIGGVAWTGAPVFAEPGSLSRLYRYFSSNTAETAHGHPFPELRVRCYRETPEVLFQAVAKAARELDWRVAESRPGAYSADAVATTSLLRFRDDVTIELRPVDCGTELWIVSSSRIGRADLGANVRHIMEFTEAFERLAGVEPL